MLLFFHYSCTFSGIFVVNTRLVRLFCGYICTISLLFFLSLFFLFNLFLIKPKTGSVADLGHLVTLFGISRLTQHGGDTEFPGLCWFVVNSRQISSFSTFPIIVCFTMAYFRFVHWLGRNFVYKNNILVKCLSIFGECLFVFPVLVAVYVLH